MPRSFPRRAGLTLMELLVVLVILLALGTLLIPTLSWFGERSQQFASRESMLRLRELLLNHYIPNMGELPRPRLELTTGGSPTRINHPQLVYLFVNPDFHEDGDVTNDFNTPGNILSGRSWQGPYVTHSGAKYYVTDTDASLTTGTNYTARYGVGVESTLVGDPTVIDAWGHPIVLQEPDLDSNGIADEYERRHTRIVCAGRNGVIETPPDVLMPTVAQRGDDLVLFLYRHDDFGDGFFSVDLQP